MKRSINIIAIFVTCLLMVSCSKKFYPGEYFRVVENVSYEVFKINSDSSFEYTYRAGWNKNNSKGKWKLQSNSIIVLSSQYKRGALPMSVESSHQKNTNGYLFKFNKYYSRKDNPNLWQVLIINNKDSFKIEDSIANIKYPDELKTFRVEIVTTEYLNDSTGMYRISTENYTVQSKRDNDFLLSYPFDWTLPYYRDFDNEILKIKNRGVYWPVKQQKYRLK
jgi:hypothetical protein